MERPIGEKFKFEGRTLEVVESDSCKGCVFDVYFCYKKYSIVGRCYFRKDNKSVIFKEV